MPARILFAALGAVFGLVWVSIGLGWAVVVLLCALVAYYIGALLEGAVDPDALLAPFRSRK